MTTPCDNCKMITSAFSCTGPYAVLIMLGIKRVENRSVMPVPAKGRCAVSCSKSFCKEEYSNFLQWAAHALPEEEFERIPAWGDVKEWPGKIVGACAYEARGRNDLRLEGEMSEGCIRPMRRSRGDRPTSGTRDMRIGGIYLRWHVLTSRFRAGAMWGCGSCPTLLPCR